MSKVASPPTHRVVQVLEFLRSHPTDQFTLTEIARSLTMTKGTCHAVLTTLVEAGYLTRHPDSKGYGLGPALVGLGRAAETSFTIVASARSALAELHARLQLPCTAVARRGDDLVVIEQYPTDSESDGLTRIGQRVPFEPPFGEAFAAWASDHERETWVDAARPGDRRRLEEVLNEVRVRGYTVQRLNEGGVQFGLAVLELADGMPKRARSLAKQLITELDQRDLLEADFKAAIRQRVTVLSAPVFGPTENVELSISIWPRREMSQQQVRKLATSLLATTTRLSDLLRKSS